MGTREKSSKYGTMAFWSLVIILVAAFLTRLFPLSMSPFPYNNDSLTECGLASEILESGHLKFSSETPWYGSHSGATPLLNILLAFQASWFGVDTFQCAQLLDAIVAITTIGALFLLGRLFSGSVTGGLVAGFMGLMMGTFVFTTGSVWKEMLGMSLLVFVLYSFIRRAEMRFRILTFVILMVMPLVHHLVAAVTILVFAYLLTWSWYFALANGSPKKRHLADLVTIIVPTAWAGAFYSVASFDRLAMFSSPLTLSLFVSSFALISIVVILVLSIRNHAKWSLAPVAGGGLLALVALDYFGFLFPYSPSASDAYFLLGIASAFLFGLSWYGTEIIVETRPVYRAVQVALAVSPLSIIGSAMLHGFSLSSQQVLYRTFDFLDIFIFIGAAVAVVELRRRHKKLYPAIASFMIISLAISFPFAYESEALLGVRHDTQAYELEGVEWLADHAQSPLLVTDERLGYIAQSTAGLTKYNALPLVIIDNRPIFVGTFYLAEDSWTTSGVNAYPEGKVVLPEWKFAKVVEAADVFYIGGPANDHATIFVGSTYGNITIYGSES